MVVDHTHNARNSAMMEAIEGADGGRGSEGGFQRGDPATVRSRRASKPRHKAVALDGTRDSVVPQACIDSDVALAMERAGLVESSLARVATYEKQFRAYEIDHPDLSGDS